MWVDSSSRTEDLNPYLLNIGIPRIMSGLTNELKKFAQEKGADLVRVAPVERFKHAPYGAKPEDLLPGARGVVSIGISVTRTALDVWDCTHTPYQLGVVLTSEMLDNLSSHLVRFLEKRGCRALLSSATYIGMRSPYDREEGFVQGARVSEFSHRHAAVAAGLGEFGHNSLLLTPEYGAGVRVTSVITDAPLRPDAMYRGPRLCTGCYKCVDVCPMNAISKTRTVKVRYPDRLYEYAVVDFSRCQWGQSLGLHPEGGSWHIGLLPPRRIDTEVLHKHSKRYPKGRNRQICGLCVIFCSSRVRRGNKFEIREIPESYKKSILYCPGGILDTITIEETVAGKRLEDSRECYGKIKMSLHRYDKEGISYHHRAQPAWKRNELLKSEAVKDWIYHVGSDQKKSSYLQGMRKYSEFAQKTPENLIEEATLSKGLTLDDKLGEFLAHLEKKGTSEGCTDNYLGVRSFFVWNGFIEKLRMVPEKLKKVVATDVYDYYKILDK